MARRMSLFIIVLLLALAAAGYGALHYMTAVPGKPHRGRVGFRQRRVMPGLVPAISLDGRRAHRIGIAGTSPAMTERGDIMGPGSRTAARCLAGIA